MRLLAYLEKHKTTQAEFAERIGTTAATVCRIADGSVVPRRDLMNRIHKVTGGNVTPNDLLGLHYAKAPTPKSTKIT